MNQFFRIFVLLLLGTTAAAQSPVTVIRGTGLNLTTAPAQWVPVTGLSFDVQLEDPTRSSQVPAVKVVELDIDIDPTILTAVKARGIKTLCYFSAGSWESYRSDQTTFPAAVRGRNYSGYPQERWLDIRAITTLRPIMQARMNRCKTKGFDGIDPDNVDGYTNPTGFPLTQAQQIAYNQMLLQEAHARNLVIALKNAPELAGAMNGLGYDLAVTESCFKDNFCSSYTPFIHSGKPVFAMEYLDERMSLPKFCPQAKRLGFSAILKRSSSRIDSYRQACS